MFEISTHFGSAAKAMAHLNALTEVRKSVVCKTNFIQRFVQKIIPALAEKGLFAKKDIPTGTVVGEYIGRQVTFQEAWDNPACDMGKIVWENTGRPERGRYSEIGLAMANHSKEQFNMAMRNDFTVITTRDDKAGEELTWDYARASYS